MQQQALQAHFLQVLAMNTFVVGAGRLQEGVKNLASVMSIDEGEIVGALAPEQAPTTTIRAPSAADDRCVAPLAMQAINPACHMRAWQGRNSSACAHAGEMAVNLIYAGAQESPGQVAERVAREGTQQEPGARPLAQPHARRRSARP